MLFRFTRCCSKLHFLTPVFLNRVFPPSIFCSSSRSSLKMPCPNSPAVVPGSIKILPPPLKSESDKKEYRVIQLENGLVACLISDVELSASFSQDGTAQEEDESEGHEGGSSYGTDDQDEEEKLAAAALCISVGSFSDPQNIQGLAHFVEHMVFMGSEKYPEENGFDAFLKKCCGKSNACTDYEYTVFHFECNPSSLLEALDRFAQFFISPLMKRDSMEREKQAVHSEFQSALLGDDNRMEQLLLSFKNKSVPLNEFAWGNEKTLSGEVSDDVLHEEVHKFKEKHYAANRMTLCVQACMPLDELEKYVVNTFSSAKPNNVNRPDFSKYGKYFFDMAAFHNIYFVKPVKAKNYVTLMWVCDSIMEKYKQKPHYYISNLIENKEKGSLMSFLRTKLWILGIDTNSGNESNFETNSMFHTFSITLSLTDKGVEEYLQVLDAVFSYLNFLKSVEPTMRLFEELQTIENTQFRFQIECDPEENVETICENMHSFPSKDYLTGAETVEEYDPEGIKHILSQLEPSTVNISISSTEMAKNVSYDKTEKWFETPYTSKPISEEMAKKWAALAPRPEFALPEPNIYIPTNFKILNLTNYPQHPLKIVDKPTLQVWYKPDSLFRLPHCHMYFHFVRPFLHKNPNSDCTGELTVAIAAYLLEEDTYPAIVTGLYFKYCQSLAGFKLQLNGYNEKLMKLLFLIGRLLVELPQKVTLEIFLTAKATLMKSYENAISIPSVCANNIAKFMVIENYYTCLEKRNALDKITYDSYLSACKDCLSFTAIHALVQGNMSQEEAIQICSDFFEIMKVNLKPGETKPTINVKLLQEKEKVCRFRSFLPDDVNSSIVNYYQYGKGSLDDRMKLELFMEMCEEALFDTLRTKEQLSYDVRNHLTNSSDMLGYQVLINAQADKYSPHYVDDRIESFLDNYVKTVLEMSSEDVEAFKDTLINLKKLPDNELGEEARRNFDQIVKQRFEFDRLLKEVAALEKLSVKDFKHWLKDHRKGMKKFSIQIVGHNGTDAEKNAEKKPDQFRMLNEMPGESRKREYFVSDIVEYKNTLDLLPHKFAKKQ